MFVDLTSFSVLTGITLVHGLTSCSTSLSVVKVSTKPIESEENLFETLPV